MPAIRFDIGKWHHFQTHIKMNTPGKADGIMRHYYDGVKTSESFNLEWRSGDHMGIDYYILHYMWGGSSDAAPNVDASIYRRDPVCGRSIGALREVGQERVACGVRQQQCRGYWASCLHVLRYCDG